MIESNPNGLAAANTIALTNTPAGYWLTNADSEQPVVFAVHQRPTDARIAYTEQLMGWKWKDAV